MKINSMLIALMIILTSCGKSKEQKIKTVIKAYLDTTLNDNSSYNPVSWGIIDTAYALGLDNPLYEVYKDSADYFYEVSKSVYILSPAHDKSFAQWRRYSDSSIAVLKRPYYGKSRGWQIEHKYRAKNKMGALILQTTIFTLNDSLNRVIDTEEKD